MSETKAVLDLIASIESDLARLKGIVQASLPATDPANPHNKSADGKLTPEGVECCYRMFDEGKTRYTVARAMKISFAAATHRFRAWREAGGETRRGTRLG